MAQATYRRRKNHNTIQYHYFTKCTLIKIKKINTKLYKINRLLLFVQKNGNFIEKCWKKKKQNFLPFISSLVIQSKTMNIANTIKKIKIKIVKPMGN